MSWGDKAVLTGLSIGGRGPLRASGAAVATFPLRAMDDLYARAEALVLGSTLGLEPPQINRVQPIRGPIREPSARPATPPGEAAVVQFDCATLGLDGEEIGWDLLSERCAARSAPRY